MTQEAQITPDVLVWARKRADATYEKIARRISKTTTPELVIDWEKGKSFPTMAQAEKIAKVLHVPFGYLFLSKPPDDVIPITDFRTVANAGPATSGNLVDIINSVIFKQSWYKDHLLNQGEPPIAFIGKYNEQRPSPKIVAQDILSILKITKELRAECDTWRRFLSRVVVRTERSGILVMRSRFVNGNYRRPITVSKERFRGLAISDSIAPVIFLNTDDSTSAQIFTLFHELAHLWIGRTAISNQDVDVLSATFNADEAFCDAVAAESLAPSEVVHHLWDKGRSAGENIDVIRTAFKVSGLVAIRRAFETRHLSSDEYRQLYLEELAMVNTPKPKKDGGSYISNLLARNSRTFTTAVVIAARRGQITYRDAGSMLDLRPDTVFKLSEKLKDRRRL